MDVKHQSQADLPKEFWWAEGREALQADWTSGDFSTWIEGNTDYKAFGVEFGLDGVIEMLPAYQRAIVARSLSVASNPNWVTAKVSRRITYERMGFNPTIAGQAFVELGRQGFVSARAVMAECYADHYLGQYLMWSAHERDVPNWFWTNFTESGNSQPNWEFG
jgi:hypothetical protein